MPLKIKLSINRMLALCGTLAILMRQPQLPIRCGRSVPDQEESPLGAPTEPGPGTHTGKPMRGGKGGPGRMGALAGRLLLRPNIKQELGLTPDQVSRDRKLDYEMPRRRPYQSEAQVRQALLDLRESLKPTRPDRENVYGPGR